MRYSDGVIQKIEEERKAKSIRQEGNDRKVTQKGISRSNRESNRESNTGMENEID